MFISIQGVQGAIPEGPEPIPELKNIKKINFFKFFKNSIFYFEPGGHFFALGPPVTGPGGGSPPNAPVF